MFNNFLIICAYLVQVRRCINMKHYKLWLHISIIGYIVCIICLAFTLDISPMIPAVPQCPLKDTASCPYAYCLKTLKPCYPTGDPRTGICCADVYIPAQDQFGCCQYNATNVRLCVCTDENGVQRKCVDRYGYPYYSGDCKDRWWAVPDPTFRCCGEGSKKGQCEYITYPCN